MKSVATLIIFIFSSLLAQANLKYNPISFVLSTDKESYFEGEKITFNITITNNDKENTFPVLIPHTQNVGQKLFVLNVYDKASNTMLLRYTEDKMLKMMVHDTGTVKIKYLKPLEQIVIPIYINDFENYYSYHTQTASHHSLGVPLFAGIYKVNVSYNPMGIALGDSIYNYYNDTEKELPNNGKLALAVGEISPMIELKIKRSADTIVKIENKKYYVKKEYDRYFYLLENLAKIVTDVRCEHITNLPPDSSSLPKGEYFYSHFTDIFNEYINRYDDGDILEYRKFRDECPDYLYTEKYDAFKNKTFFACQLYDRKFYSVSYNQPGSTKHQETYCSADGTLCNVTTFFYNKDGTLKKTDVTQTSPCIEVILEGKKKYYKKATNLGTNDE